MTITNEERTDNDVPWEGAFSEFAFAKLYLEKETIMTISTEDRVENEPKPCLTMRVKVSEQMRSATFSGGPRPYQEHPEDKTIDSGFDPNGPAGHTWWRIVEREGLKFYLSTIMNRGDKVLATKDGHHVCRPGQYLQLETEL